MPGSRRLLFAVFFASATASAQAAAPAPMQLEDAVRLALANNERARKAPLRVEVAEGQLDRARDAFFPSVTASGTGALRAHEDRNGRIGDTSTALTLNQPILNPSSFPLYAQARHTRDAEKWNATQDLRQLGFDTAKSFLQTLSTERVLQSARQRLDRARANQDNAEARAQAQLASVNDVTRAHLDVANASRDVVQAEANVARAYIQLGFLVGRKVAPPLAPPDRTTRAAESFESPAADQVRAALARRPDVQASHERTRALEIGASEPLYRMIPSLTAQAQMRMLPAPLPTERGVDETLTLNLSWSLFDAGFRYADRRTRLAQAESQSLDEKLLARSVEADVSTALASLRAAREQFKITELAVTAAKTNVDETQILYRQGLARALELTDANAKLFDAEVGRETAKLGMEQAYLELRFALGFGPLDEETHP